MTRTAAARLIFNTPQGKPIDPEIVAAALPDGTCALPEEYCWFEGTMSVDRAETWTFEPTGGPCAAQMEFDLSGVVHLRAGLLVFAAYRIGRAYRFGPLFLERSQDGTLFGWDRAGDCCVVRGLNPEARPVGVVAFWRRQVGKHQTRSVMGPYGAPWTDDDAPLEDETAPRLTYRPDARP